MKAWRESASVIIAARSGLNYDQLYDYNVLFLKRHKKANAYANFYVFPGGMIESADSDLKWHKFFKDHGYNESSFKSLFPNAKKRPEIFHSQENELPREISLRICAIRETFEECGILLCKKSHQTTAPEVADNFSIPFTELEYWQNKVILDANEFYNMCEKLQCLPNIWVLHEWGNWLSPTFLPSTRRFNTAFFFTCLTQIPNSKLGFNEMEELLWSSPEYMKSLKASLPMPQQYEMSKIEKYHSLDSLLQFALENSKNGVQRYFPIKVVLLDGIVILLPGDSMYPEEVNLYKQEDIDKSSMTIKEFRRVSPNTHRIEFSNNSKITNIESSKL